MSQELDQSELKSRLSCDYSYLTKGINVVGRSFRFGITSVIRKFSPDIVITHEYSPMTIWIVLLGKINRYNFHHLVWTDDNPESILNDSVIRKLLRRITLPNIQGAIFVSAEAKEFYSLEYNFSLPFAIVPIIQKEDVFRARLKNSDIEVRKLARVHRLIGRRVILYVGRLERIKRIDRIIHAFASIHCTQMDAVVVLVGDGSERKALEQLASQRGVSHAVIFAGHQEGGVLSAWYRLANVFVLASEFERFGAVVNEALLAGIPVLCSKSAGSRILVPTGGGEVIDVADQTALETGMREWLDKSPAQIGIGVGNIRNSLMSIQFEDVVASCIRLLRSL
jgi:glycosyltransferase involved in cell wall biosynthesis